MHVQAQVVLGAPSKKGHVPSSPKGLQAVWLRLPEQVRSFLHDLQVIGIVATWCVVVMTGIFTPLLIVLFFPHRFAILWAAVLAILSLWPLEDSIVLPAARFICGVCVKAAIRYFPVEVYVEHADELRPGTPYIVGRKLIVHIKRVCPHGIGAWGPLGPCILLWSDWDIPLDTAWSAFFSEAVVTWVASKLGFLPVYVYGYGFLPMPLRTRMRVVIGRAIAVPKVEKPSHALIEEYLQRFIASMADLYDRHCKAAGCQDRKLEIL